MVDARRVRTLNKKSDGNGPVIYWMSRDQRLNNNWALLFAQQKAKELNQPLAIVFNLVPSFLGATSRQYDFMIKGLQELERSAKKIGIPLYVVTGTPATTIPGIIKKYGAGAVVTDFSPLKISQQWKSVVTKKLPVAFYEVDAHNIAPCWYASPKQEFAARTIRPKITKLLPQFLTPFPKLLKHTIAWKEKVIPIDWSNLQKSLKVDTKVLPITWINPGETAAKKMCANFIKNKLPSYDAKRNDPNLDGQSNLSPFLHFGQISAQQITLDVLKQGRPTKSAAAFLEELIIRRELADNFCFYNKNYDSEKGFPAWAQKTLQKHAHDKRPYLYSLKQFEQAKTHDNLWNAAQRQMVVTGKMHGFLRMYWAKKILEWTKSPTEAMKIAVYLNDKYELDGRDPNGYTGIAWSIGGVHDRPWGERNIFGMIRYMSYEGCKKKFDVTKLLGL